MALVLQRAVAAIGATVAGRGQAALPGLLIVRIGNAVRQSVIGVERYAVGQRFIGREIKRVVAGGAGIERLGDARIVRALLRVLQEEHAPEVLVSGRRAGAEIGGNDLTRGVDRIQRARSEAEENRGIESR